MKRLILSLLIAGACYTAYAQGKAQQKGDTTSQAPYENKDDNAYRQQSEMVAVSADDLPEPLQTTLKQSRYRGWEHGTMMRTPDGSVYEFRLNKGKNVKVYRFDAQGKPIDE